MPTPRPHYKERIAHAEGYEIESRFGNHDVWLSEPDPEWYDNWQYRVKPEPVDDIVIPWGVTLISASNGIVNFHTDSKNLRLTFDGETGKLKSAEVIGG